MVNAPPPGRRFPLLDPFRAVVGNPGLRRVVGAYIGFSVGEWATWIAILVFAFEQGGATEAAVVAVLQLIPAAVVAPLGSSLGDRFPRERVLFLGYAVQATTMSLTALALAAGAPNAVVYVAAAATATAVTLTRPAHGSTLPSLARTPAELTAANVASGTVSSAAVLVAPAVTGLVLHGLGPGAVFALAAIGCGASAAVVAWVRIDRIAGLVPAPPGRPRSTLAELAGGFRTIAGLSGPRTIVGLIAAESAIEGAIDILLVILALELLSIGEAGVGFLNSAIGAGGLLGAVVAVGLVGRRRLGRPFAGSLVLASLPLAVTGLGGEAFVAFGALLVIGLGRALMEVAGWTLLQRVTPDVSLARVFGVLEGMRMAMLAIGSAAVPLVVGVLGPENALIAASIGLPLVAFVGLRALDRVDRTAVVHVRELELLRGLPMFAPLSPPTIERLSARLTPHSASHGERVISQGEPGDRFYVVDDGRLEVFVDGVAVRTLGPGDGFGEIALLRDVPRTATVLAAGPARLYALEREVFLAAVAGHPEGRRAAEGLAADRMAAAGD